MRHLFAILLTFSVCAVFGQNNNGNANMKVEMTREAYYAQGDQALFTYVFNNLKYTEEAKAAKASGEIMLSFWVEKDSTLSDIKILSDVGYSVGDNLRELMKTVKYVPALVNGTLMRSKLILNVPVRAK